MISQVVKNGISIQELIDLLSTAKDKSKLVKIGTVDYNTCKWQHEMICGIYEEDNYIVIETPDYFNG